MFNNIMHVAFYTDHIEEMMDFYVNKLGATPKVITRFKDYLNRPDRPLFYQMAQTNPEGIFNVYLEIAQGQFIELFPKMPNQVEDNAPWNSRLGYTHYAMTVDDIYETRRILEERGVSFDTDISKGPSETYQMWMHDPDGNKFEVMQYTENSYQVKGHGI